MTVPCPLSLVDPKEGPHLDRNQPQKKPSLPTLGTEESHMPLWPCLHTPPPPKEQPMFMEGQVFIGCLTPNRAWCRRCYPFLQMRKLRLEKARVSRGTPRGGSWALNARHLAGGQRTPPLLLPNAHMGASMEPWSSAPWQVMHLYHPGGPSHSGAGLSPPFHLKRADLPFPPDNFFPC